MTIHKSRKFFLLRKFIGPKHPLLAARRSASLKAARILCDGVKTVNLKTGDEGKASDALHAASGTAAASSVHLIALCGGSVAF